MLEDMGEPHQIPLLIRHSAGLQRSLADGLDARGLGVHDAVRRRLDPPRVKTRRTHRSHCRAVPGTDVKDARTGWQSPAQVPTRGEPGDDPRTQWRDVGSKKVNQRGECQPDRRGLTLGVVAIGIRVPRTQIGGNRVSAGQPALRTLHDRERARQPFAVIAGPKTSRPTVTTADGTCQLSHCPCLVARACHRPPAPSSFGTKPSWRKGRLDRDTASTTEQWLGSLV